MIETSRQQDCGIPQELGRWAHLLDSVLSSTVDRVLKQPVLTWVDLGGMWDTDGPVRHMNGLFHVVILVRVVHAFKK